VEVYNVSLLQPGIFSITLSLVLVCCVFVVLP